MARPRALACLGWSHWLQGRQGAARRAWTRAIREAERLAMPWELANAHHQLGRHLAAGQRSPLGLDRTEHLDRAQSTFEALGCRTTRQGQPPPTAGRPERRSRPVRGISGGASPPPGRFVPSPQSLSVA
jgi:hypothetical protein